MTKGRGSKKLKVMRTSSKYGPNLPYSRRMNDVEDMLVISRCRGGARQLIRRENCPLWFGIPLQTSDKKSSYTGALVHFLTRRNERLQIIFYSTFISIYDETLTIGCFVISTSLFLDIISQVFSAQPQNHVSISP